MAVFDHIQRLDLHRRESGQSAAQSRAEHGAPVARQRQPLQQSGGEVPDQEGADDVDRECRPRPTRRVADGQGVQGGAGQGAQRPAGENRGQLAIVVLCHGPIPFGVPVIASQRRGTLKLRKLGKYLTSREST